MPLTINRIGAGYHDESVVNELASATGIRMRVAKGESVFAFMTDAASSILSTALNDGMTVHQEHLFRMLVYALQQEEKEIEHLYQVDVGIGRRMHEASVEAANYVELVDSIKSRQLTRTRIQRLLTYVLLGLDAGVMKELLDCGPLYLHVLGQSKAGEAFLHAQRKDFELPLVANYSRIYSQLKRYYAGDPERMRLAQEQLKWELRATRIFSLLLPGFSGVNRNRDFYQAVIRDIF